MQEYMHKKFIEFTSFLRKEKTSYAQSRERKIPTLPHISFDISSKQEDIVFLQELERIRQSIEASWNPIETDVLAAYESITHEKWDKQYREQGIPVTLTATEGSKTKPFHYLQLGCREVKSPWAKHKSLIGTMRNTTSLTGSLVHELSHNFANQEDIKFLEDNFSQRVNSDKVNINDNKALHRFFLEVHAELLSKAVADKCFPKETVESWIERQQVAHKGVYDLIRTLSEEEIQAAIDRTYRATSYMPAEDRQKIGDVRLELEHLTEQAKSQEGEIPEISPEGD